MEEPAEAVQIISDDGLVRLVGTDKSYCCLCSISVRYVEAHLLVAKHRIFLKRFNEAFVNEGDKIYCKATCSYVRWDRMKSHALWQGITPWFNIKPHSKVYFENHMTKVSLGWYCFLCHKLFDFWDTAERHMDEVDHKNSKEAAGSIEKFQRCRYILFVTQGFVPGRDGRSLDCRMCDESGLVGEKVQSHFPTARHRENREKFLTDMTKLQEIENIDPRSVSPTVEKFKSKETEDDIPNVHNADNIELQRAADIVHESSHRQSLDIEIVNENVSLQQQINVNQQQNVTNLKHNMLLAEEKKCEARQQQWECRDFPTNPIGSSPSKFSKTMINRSNGRAPQNIFAAKENKLNPDDLLAFPELGHRPGTKKSRKIKRHDVGRKRSSSNNNDYCITSNDNEVDRTQGDHDEIENGVDQMKSCMKTEEEGSPLNGSNSRDGPVPLYIVKRNAKKSFCQICDDKQNSVATRNINDHINSERHRIALKRYGCENIHPEENGVYHCRSCDCKLDDPESVYLHIKEKKHLSLLIKCTNNVDQMSQRTFVSPTFVEDPAKPSKNLLSGYIEKQMNKSYTYNVYDSSGRGMISNFTIQPDILDSTTISQRFENNRQSWLEKCTTRRSFDDFSSENKFNGIETSNGLAEVIWTYSNNSEDTREEGVAILSSLLMSKGIESDKQPELITFTSSMVSEISRLIANCDANKMKCRVKERKTGRVNVHSEMDSKQKSCDICDAKFPTKLILHVHMAGHYTEEFVRFKTKRDAGTMENANSDATNDFDRLPGTINGPKSPNNNNEEDESSVIDEIPSKHPVWKKKRSRTMDMKKVLELLDFDDDYIYDLNDKMSEVEMGLKLALPMDSTKVYCMICREIVEHTLENYIEHLSNVDHCGYLDEMETDSALHDADERQLSDLDLAHEYMEEISDDEVRCIICDVEVRNNECSLRGHINHEVHERKCEQTRAIATKYFEGMKPRLRCDWYNVEKYWCVVCLMKTESEVKFVHHLNSRRHKKCLKEPVNVGKPMFFDHCESCALLWYGYRSTFSYHRETRAHKWHERDRYYLSVEITDKAKYLLCHPEKFIDDKVEYLDRTWEVDRALEKLLISDLEATVRIKYPKAKGYLFGSRLSGLSSVNSDVDVFLDCQNVYDGNPTKQSMIGYFIEGVHGCLKKYSETWGVEEVLSNCRTPIIKARHRATGLSCDISFENGLAVENSQLLKSYFKIFPTCRKLTLFLKQWLSECNLSNSGSITNYALSWYVIFYLQKLSVLPSVASLLELGKKSRLVAGWEVGVIQVTADDEEICDISIREFLIGFFTFYADFDFRHEVASPLLGDSVKKRCFGSLRQLPKGMERYHDYISTSGNPEHFRIDSPMGLQDPFDLQHNLTKAVSKAYVNRFRKYCIKSLDLLRPS